MTQLARRCAAAALACLWLACEEPAAQRAAIEPIDERLGLSRDAKRDIFASVRADMVAERHASDGGGRAWIESIEDGSGRPVA